jgi:hypothetical protein
MGVLSPLDTVLLRFRPIIPCLQVLVNWPIGTYQKAGKELDQDCGALAAIDSEGQRILAD